MGKASSTVGRPSRHLIALWVVTLVAAILSSATLSGSAALGANAATRATATIDVEKDVSVDGGQWLDADTPTGPEAVAGSDTVRFRFTVTNTGTETLEQVTLTDSAFQAAIDATCGIPSTLTPGQSARCIIGPFATELGQHRNEATVTGLPPGGANVTFPLPGDGVHKKGVVMGFVNGETVVGYTNKGSVDIAGPDFVPSANIPTLGKTMHLSCSDSFGFDDNDPSNDGWSDDSGDFPNPTDHPDWRLTGVHIVKSYEDDKVTPKNWCDSGERPEGVKDTDLAHYIGLPGIALLKDVSIDEGATWHPADTPGSGPEGIVGVNVVHFRFTATNIGLTTLEDLVLTDPDYQAAIDATCALTDPLAPGDSTECIIGPFPAQEGEQRNEATINAIAPGVGGSDHLDLHRQFGGKYVFTFIMEDGQVVEGTSESNEAAVPGFVQPFHVSCSDGFGFDDPDLPDGWGEKGSPVFGSGDNGPIVDYLITNFETSDPNDDRVKKTCGEGDITPDPIPVMDSNLAHYSAIPPTVEIHVEKSTNSDDADLPPGPFVAERGSVEWRFVVTNPGNVGLINVTVEDDIEGLITDFLGGDTNGDGVLDPGETWTYRRGGTALLGNTVDGQYANLATATGTPIDRNGTPFGGPVSDDDPSHYFVPNAAVHIEKSTNGEDADAAPGPFVADGSDILWRFEVTNPGNVGLVNVTVVDDKEGAVANPTGDTDGDGVLDTDETWVYELTEKADLGATDDGQYENLATVTGTPADPAGNPIPGANDVTDDDPSHYFVSDAAIHIEKSTNGEDADAAPGPFVEEGKRVVWLYDVTNPGNVGLVNVTVADDVEGAVTDFLGGDSDADGVLDPGERWRYRLRGNADLAKTDAGQYANVGTATGTPADDAGNPIPGASDVMDDDPSHYVTGTIDLDIEKFTIRIRDGVETEYQADTRPGPALVENQPVKWRYVVTNGGNLPAANVMVTDEATFDGDPVAAPTPVFVGGDDNNDGLLDPGETWIYEAEGTVLLPTPGGDPLCADQYANLGTVTGEDPAGTVDSDTDPSHYCAAFLEGITIEKSTNGVDADLPEDAPEIRPGNAVRWRYRVHNGGNVALKDVVVDDDIEGPPTFVRGDDNNNGILDKGEAWIYRITGVATEGLYRNESTVTGIPIDIDGTEISGPVTDDDPSHYDGRTVDPPPEAVLDIEKFTVRIRDGVETRYQADRPPGPALVENQPVKWRYVVTNRGNAPASNVVVTDEATFDGNPVTAPVPVFVSGDTNNDGFLNPGETWIYEAEGTVRLPRPGAPGQNPLCADQYANLGTVTGEWLKQDGTTGTSTDSDPSHYCSAFLEGITIEKSTNSLDADLPEHDDDSIDGPDDQGPDRVPLIDPGKAVRWRFRLGNEGNVALKDVTIVDVDMNGVERTPELIRGDDNNNGILDKGEAWIYRLVGVAIEGQYSNVATIRGTPIDVDGTVIDDPVEDEDSSQYSGGAAPDVILDLQKFTVRIRNGVESAFQADTPPGPALVENQPMKWRYVVTNRGTLPASNVTVTDEATFEGQAVVPPLPLFISGDDNGDGLLDPGERWVFEATGTVLVPKPQTPGVLLGRYANVGTVTAEAPDGTPHSDTDPSHYVAAFLDGITIEKSTNSLDADAAPGPSIEAGKAVRWRYRVANEGNVALKDVIVIDDMEGAAILTRGDDNNNGILDKGEAWIYRLNGTADEGQYSNLATITGTPIDVDGTVIDDPVSDSDLSHYFGTPRGNSATRYGIL